jgi:hypothetical protein
VRAQYIYYPTPARIKQLPRKARYARRYTIYLYIHGEESAEEEQGAVGHSPALSLLPCFKNNLMRKGLRGRTKPKESSLPEGIAARDPYRDFTSTRGAAVQEK